MPNKPQKVGKDSESSASQSDNEETPQTKGDGRKSRDEKKIIKRPGQKRFSGSLGATSGNVVQTGHSSKKDYTESPSKRTRRDRPPLVHANAFDECSCGEGSNHAVSCMRNLELKDEIVEKEPQPPDVPERVASAAELQQSPKMSHLAVPGHSSGGQPTGSEVRSTSPKEKGVVNRIIETGKKFLGRLSPKNSPDKGSSSEKSDLKLKQKPLKVNPLNLNPSRSEASSSSSSPISKICDSSPDRSLPSTSSSGPNVEYPRPATKSLHKFKSGAESSRPSTSDDSQRRVGTLNVPNESGGHHSGRSSRSQSPRRRSPSRCICEDRTNDYKCHDLGCPESKERRQKVNNRTAKNSRAYKNAGHSSSTPSDGESPRATMSPSTSTKAGLPKIKPGDPSQPGTSRNMEVSSLGNSPTLSGEAARSPNRRSPSRSPSTSRRSPRRPSPSQITQLKCTCSRPKKEGEPHEARCPFCRSPSRKC